MKEGFKHWVSVKLTNPVIDGTVTTVAGLTMPAFTAAGDISLWANKLTTTNHHIIQDSATFLGFWTAGAHARVRMGAVQLDNIIGLEMEAAGANIAAQQTNGGYAVFKAWDTGVGGVEVARLQGAADPYFQVTLPFVILPVATGALPATPVNGMVAFDDTTQKLKVRTTAAGGTWETVVSA